MSSTVKPVSGAAEYFAYVNPSGVWYVVMKDNEGFASEIQKCNDSVAASKAADKWQAKENKAVLKAAK